MTLHDDATATENKENVNKYGHKPLTPIARSYKKRILTYMIKLGTLEERLMQHLWSDYGNQSFCVREVLDSVNAAGNNYAYNTILTVITHLHEKKLLQRNSNGKTYRYTLAMSENAYVAHISKNAFEEIQKQYGPLAIAHFAHLIESVDPKTLKEAKAFLSASKKQQS